MLIPLQHQDPAQKDEERSEVYFSGGRAICLLKSMLNCAWGGKNALLATSDANYLEGETPWPPEIAKNYVL